MLKVAVLIMTLALTTCAVPLTLAGQPVKLVPESQKIDVKLQANYFQSAAWPR